MYLLSVFIASGHKVTRFCAADVLLPRLPSAEYDDARQKYTDAMHTLGYQADLAYNTALCYFKDKQYAPALKHVGELRPRELGPTAFRLSLWVQRISILLLVEDELNDHSGRKA